MRRPVSRCWIRSRRRFTATIPLLIPTMTRPPRSTR
uniref:Reticulon-like protein n=1 Tax=Rhizophora mucronata TaxID=61149 RepID=A0A2P2IHQ2_RHIMU